MHNSNIPSDRELPSTGKLIKSTVIAAAVAVVLLVTVVMPAEFGIDPTGIGNVIGLKRMGEIKVSLAKEVAEDRAIDMNAIEAVSAQPVPAQVEFTSAEAGISILDHEMQVTLAPNEGTEIKVSMLQGKKVQYSWWSDSGKVNFDAHGDSRQLGINYHSYGKGTEQRKEGQIEAAFDGSHGWFWRNRTSKTITITLITNGEYSDIKHMK